METTDVLIIGGGPAGVVAAGTVRKNNPDKKIVLVRDRAKVVIPCGIPYIFNRLDSVDKNIMGDASLEKNNIELIIDLATKIDVEAKTVLLSGGNSIKYDKLILATGSKPIQVPIKGIDKKGVWQVKKDFEYLVEMRTAALNAKNIVIIGGGFIGVELAEELSRIENLNVSIVEKLNHCLATTFDNEFSIAAEEKLRQKSVQLFLESVVEEVGGRDKVEYIKLSSGKEIPVDLIILSIGAKPNADLLDGTEIRTGKYGGIWVDEYMRTNLPDVFAIGDCAETRDFFTGQHVPVMLASTAAAEARVAGTNLYQLKVIRENRGSLNTFSTYVDGMVLSAVGLSESTATSGGYDIVVSKTECSNHHPGSLPNTKPIIVKLVFSKSSGILLGGQIMGPESVSEMINIVSLAIQQENTAYELMFLQVSTHPLLTPAPTISPLITAAQHAVVKLIT